MWRYTMRYKKLLFLDFICVFGFILIELGLPTILARMIDVGIKNNDYDYVKQQGLLMIFVMIYLKKYRLFPIVNMKRSVFHH